MPRVCAALPQVSATRIHALGDAHNAAAAYLTNTGETRKRIKDICET